MKILVSLVHAPAAEIHIPYDRHYEVSSGPNPYQNPIGHLNDGVILLLRPEPSGFCFLLQISAFVILTSLGLPNLYMKGKTKGILVVLVK